MNCERQNGALSCHNEDDRPIFVPDATMQYSFHGLTDAGSVRTNNEDALTIDAEHGIVVLADGMGGYNAGEVASNMATEFIQAELAHWITTGLNRHDLKRIARALEMCADEANLSILNAAIANPHYAGMGTTLVVAVFQGPHLVLGHIGDSRCYRLRDGRLEQLTRDHSVLQEQVDAGLLTREQAAVAPGRNLLTRALGVETTTRIEIHVHLVQADDVYLLCSDGLSDMVADRDIATILSVPGNLSHWADALIRRAIANGGRDNVTVLLAQAQPADPTTGWLQRVF